MKSKSYIENKVTEATVTLGHVVNDLENNRPYVTVDFLVQKLKYIEQVLKLSLDRIQLEDENP